MGIQKWRRCVCVCVCVCLCMCVCLPHVVIENFANQNTTTGKDFRHCTRRWKDAAWVWNSTKNDKSFRFTRSFELYFARKQYVYRPRTKFAKVMFSQVFVCPQMGGLHLGVGSLHPGGGESASKGVGQTPPPSDTTGYGQRAGGTHPTGMHSCFGHKLTKFQLFHPKK